MGHAATFMAVAMTMATAAQGASGTGNGAGTGSGTAGGNGGAASADETFRALYTAEYEWRRQQQGPGEDSSDDRVHPLPDASPAAQAARLARFEATLAALDAIKASDLSPGEQVNYAVYRGQVQALRNAQAFLDWQMPANSDSSFWGDLAYVPRRDLRTEQDYHDYLAMLREVPRWFGQNVANMRAGLARGFTPPRITLEARDAGVAGIAGAKRPEDTVYYEPLRKLPATMAADTAAALRAEAVEVIRTAVMPAHQQLLAFLRTEYVPGARTTLGASELPDGRAYYQSKVAEYTTLDRTPEQVHATGLAEVARIRARMVEVMRGTGFKGDLPAFLAFLRSDPRFYVKTPRELLERAAYIAKAFDGKAAQYFGRLPRKRFAIKPVPDELAPFYTAGRGGPGTYWLNTYRLESRPLYSLPALTLHESAPGHAFQMPLSLENHDLPAFRRDTYLSVYGEGWALYCEALGEEMGMYETPYEVFGMLGYQAWRASRLVVDTGVHALGWSREQARQYLRDNTALPGHEIETEVDRYISWPGQALSYYTGEMAIVAARQRAQQALGAKFNIRAFHDAVLALGGVPVAEIDRRIDQLISDEGRGPYPDEE